MQRVVWLDEGTLYARKAEVVKMDVAILMAQSKLEVIAMTLELLRAYERYKKAVDYGDSLPSFPLAKKL